LKIRVRFSIRSLLALVAVVALVSAVIFEIRNHSRRDLLLSKVMSYYMAATWHCHEAMNCRGQSSLYTRIERLKENRNYYPGAIPGQVTSWGMEASFHDEWAQRLGVKAEAHLRQLEEIDAKLLFH
jgi:hypothetical protein